MALDPAQPEALAQILAPLVAKSDWPNALATAETAAETAPQVAELWMIAADLAQKSGRNALAIAYMQRSLCLAPSLPAAHSKAERLYQALGNPTAATCRRTMADRMSAYSAKFKEIGD